MMDGGRSSSIEISRDGTAITIHVPLTFRRRGGRKLIVSPTGEQPWAAPQPRIDRPLLTLVRAFRWKEMLESGRYATVNELAASGCVSFT